MPDAGPDLPAVTWYQDVQPIVQKKCQLCHRDPPKYSAPMPLVTYEDTQATSSKCNKIYEQMVLRTHAKQDPMPPASQTGAKRPTEAELRVIAAWAAQGAPAGTPPSDGGVVDSGSIDSGTVEHDAGTTPDDSGTVEHDAGTTPDDSGTVERDGGVKIDAGSPEDAGTPDSGFSPFREVLSVRAHAAGSSDPYGMPAQRTNYVCFTITIPESSRGVDRYMTSFKYILDNDAHTHHLLLFHNKGAQKQPDGPFGCSDTLSYGNMIGGWAPGHDDDFLPANTGVKVQAGEQLVMQIHYDSVNQAGLFDQSGIDITIDDAVGFNEAGTLWAGVIWGQPLHGVSTRQGECQITRPITIFADFPHMHKLGTSITLEVKRKGTTTWTTLVDIPAWSFTDQPNIMIEPTEQQINPGDRLRTTCNWDTGTRNVGFGEASDDEMCFNFIYHYPLLPNAGLGGTCTSYAL